MALFRQISSCFPGSKEILHEHILRSGDSVGEETFHNELDRLDRKPSLPSGHGRHRLANTYIGSDSPREERHLDANGHKVSNALPSPLSMPHASDFAGARCHINITAGAGDPQHQQLGVSDSPANRAKMAGFSHNSTPTRAQRSIYEATREALLADSDDCAQFSPLSPGGPNSSRRLAELFGLFRGDPLERTGTEGPDELLSQVAAEAASGEFDNLGNPADLHDLVSSDSALTDASGFGATYPPLSLGLPSSGPMGGSSGVTQPFCSAPMTQSFGSGGGTDFSSAQPFSSGPMVLPPFSSSGAAAAAAAPMQAALSGGLVPQSEVQPMQAQSSGQLPMEHRMQRSSTMVAPIHSTQIVMAPRAASVPEVPQLPAHLATGPPSPVRRNNLAGRTTFSAARRIGLEVSAGGVAKRLGMKSKGSSGDLRVAESDAASQRSAGSDEDAAVVKKPKRASSGDRRPRRMTCNYCKTHVTPQWRCGPDGPRTLCNACGVRWGKGKLELADGTKAVHPSQAAKAAKAAAEAAMAAGQPAAPAQL